MKSVVVPTLAVIVTLIVLVARCAAQAIEPDEGPAYVCVDRNPDGTPCSHPTHGP